MNISRTTAPDGTAILTFDRPGSSANIFDRTTLDELDAHLAALEREPGVRGVVLTSAKPKIFIAGVDLHAFANNIDERALGEVVDRGQEVFTRLSRLPFPSVAAIHGVCLGGGLELSLACDWRVASTDKVTKLGLPETQLGILPAWGGSTRLPKLIGLPAALGLILAGSQIAGAKALKLGVVDELAHPEYLVETACRLVARGKRRAARRAWMSRVPLSAFVVAKARHDVAVKTRGHYPALLKAIEVCAHAVGAPIASGLAREKAAFLELVRTPECRNLLGMFFLQERAKKLSAPAPATPVPLSSVAAVDDRGEPRDDFVGGQRPPLPGKHAAIHHVAVIGAGTMGAGIAQWVSARGTPVRLKDVNPAALARGMYAIEKIYAEAVKRRVFTRPEATAGLDRITPVHTDVPLADVELVIEAALEKLDVKQQVFRDLEARVAPDTVLATNTSALSIDAIASVLAHPERVVGMHFFNPVHRMQLVEIVRGARTSSAALDTALQFAKAIGKLPVIVKDSPGFLVNRVLMPYLVEAVRLFSEGCPAKDVDHLMLEFGMPMGPLRLCDEVGLDVAQHVAKDLERRLPQGVPITDTLEKMIAKGWLGKKSGCGFYVHDPRRSSRAEPNPDAHVLQIAGPGRKQNSAMRLDRLVLLQLNEAARVLEEGVVDSPGDVDFGMIMGTGWAPFRGGPLRYADSLWAGEVVRRLDLLAHDVAPYFAPCKKLRAMANDQRPFYAAASNPASLESIASPESAPTRDTAHAH